jgi:hypothetical protein
LLRFANKAIEGFKKLLRAGWIPSPRGAQELPFLYTLDFPSSLHFTREFRNIPTGHIVDSNTITRDPDRPDGPWSATSRRPWLN